MQDTSIEIQKKYHNMLMSKTGEERFLMGISMFETARELALASFPKNINELEKRKLLVKRLYGFQPHPDPLLSMRGSKQYKD